MTENNEDTGNNIGDAVIESVQEQAAEAAEATESNDATEAMDTVEAPPAEVEAVDADPAEAESAEAPSAEEEAESAETEAGEVDADADYRRRLRKYTKELKELPGQWYIIQCYSGYENKVKTPSLMWLFQLSRLLKTRTARRSSSSASCCLATFLCAWS